MSVQRGREALLRQLASARDVRRLDEAQFRNWLQTHLERWRRDPVFRQRARIRDLRRAHPRLGELERRRDAAAEADAASAASARLAELEREIAGLRQAVQGLAAAAASAGGARAAELGDKRAAYQHRLQRRVAEHARLERASPERQQLRRAEEELQRLRLHSGVEREERRLEPLLRRTGQRAGSAGSAFEALALAATRQHLLPELAASGSGEPAQLLTGVRLGAASMELDQLVVRPAGVGRPVEVLALVEAKRNANDLAHGFRLRQENLAWLTGDPAGYAAELYRTATYRTGHFHRAAVHEQDGHGFLLARESFRHFVPDPATGLRLHRLFLITRAGPLWGVSAGTLARIGHRVATDPHWDPDDAAYLRRLLDWCRSLADATEAPDVLRSYARSPSHAGQVLLVEGGREER